MAGSTIGTVPGWALAGSKQTSLAAQTFEFIQQCARPDGGFNPSPDPAYAGRSDTGLSDLAAVTYAATLARTMGWRLPDSKHSVEFIQKHQQPDGSFVNLGGKMDLKSDLAILYNTVQGVVALRALGQRPKFDPEKVMDRFLPAKHSANCRGTPRVSSPCFMPLSVGLSRPIAIGLYGNTKSKVRARMVTWVITWRPLFTWHIIFGC